MFGFLGRIFGTNNERQLRLLRPYVEKINSLEPAMQRKSDAELGLQTKQFREQIAQGRTIDDLLFEAFALVREVSRRHMGQRHYDVQLIGGMILYQGKVAEMKTGEGKTLTATLPLYLHALSGKSSHLVTVNDYLARRDAEWMGPIYRALDMSVAALQNDMGDGERKAAYNADILYATNNELGFDYLRDNMKFRLEDYVQRGRSFAIVDEVDSILIDEARTPLIISGPTEGDASIYTAADKSVRKLHAKIDYEIDEKGRSVFLTESGMDKVERDFSVKNLYAVENMVLLHHIDQALRAHALFKRDVQYVVQEGKVNIVDEFTGRILPGRRYSDGLHQAIEAKERVDIEKESQTLASITLQNYFRMYDKLAGMTGTAATEAEEFYNIYKLDVISVPTNKPMQRIDKQDLIFLTQRAKYAAIVDDIYERYQDKQPVLVGTIAVETSEMLSYELKKRGIPHEVLNAKQHAREADIVEHAGESGRVTIATNMAGRGTDIKLTEEAKRAGGLYILGTERHESRRIDNQLRGRSGRQGDPGESRFYISLEDDLIRIFAGESLNVKAYMERFGMKEDETIESSYVSRAIERAQEKVEKRNFDIREHLLKYDDVMNQQRLVVYQYRVDALQGEETVYGLIRDFIIEAVRELVTYFCPQRSVDVAQVKKVLQEVQKLTGISQDALAFLQSGEMTVEAVKTRISTYLLEQYELYRNQTDLNELQIPPKEAEKWLILQTIDHAWKQHMLNIDHLKEGIQLRGWGQKNPLVEYKREAFDMFTEMMIGVRNDVVRHIFHLKMTQFDSRVIEEQKRRELAQIRVPKSDDASVSSARNKDKVGRNQPCQCGSGKKSKRCCR